jgi:hypothetical protein
VESYTVDVAINDVADLYGFQLNLNFDPEVLSATVAPGTSAFLASGGSVYVIPPVIDNTSGASCFIFEYNMNTMREQGEYHE